MHSIASKIANYQWDNTGGKVTSSFTAYRSASNFADWTQYYGFLKNVSGDGTMTLSGDFTLSNSAS